MIFGAIESYNDFKKLTEGETQESTAIIDPTIINDPNKKIDIDSLKNVVSAGLDKSIIPIDSVQKEEILKQVEKQATDSTFVGDGNGSGISFGGDSRFDKFGRFHKSHPDMPMDEALDSLGYEKNFKNRFLYDRSKKTQSFLKDKESRKEFVNQMLSYASISLFVLLPIFTMSLKLFYVRRKFTYVEHLIFVFHTQTVFFLLLIILVTLNFFTHNVPIWLFIVLFLLYLYLAMKRFYGQGYFKTFAKFLLVNLVYSILAIIGISFVAVISFFLL